MLTNHQTNAWKIKWWFTAELLVNLNVKVKFQSRSWRKHLAQSCSAPKYTHRALGMALHSQRASALLIRESFISFAWNVVLLSHLWSVFCFMSRNHVVLYVAPMIPRAARIIPLRLFCSLPLFLVPRSHLQDCRKDSLVYRPLQL